MWNFIPLPNYTIFIYLKVGVSSSFFSVLPYDAAVQYYQYNFTLLNYWFIENIFHAVSCLRYTVSYQLTSKISVDIEDLTRFPNKGSNDTLIQWLGHTYGGEINF